MTSGMHDVVADAAYSVERGVNIVVVNDPGQAASIWPAMAIATVLLVAAALFAHRRATLPDRRPAGRIARILWSSLACAGGVTLIMAPYETMASVILNPLDLMAIPGIKFLGWLILAILLFGSADLMLDAFRPRRTRLWLCIAPVALTLYGVGFLAASEWLEGFDPGPAGPAPLAAVLAAALIWWSLLPAPAAYQANRDVGAIFE